MYATQNDLNLVFRRRVHRSIYINGAGVDLVVKLGDHERVALQLVIVSARNECWNSVW